MDIVLLLIVWLVTAVSLYVVSIIPTGVEIDDFKKALISAGVIGLLNALLRPVVSTLALPLNAILSTFLVTLLVNAFIFGLAAWLVPGFRLKWGIWSALLGALALAFINSVLFQVLGTVF
jgi:putative membrane protein